MIRPGAAMRQDSTRRAGSLCVAVALAFGCVSSKSSTRGTVEGVVVSSAGQPVQGAVVTISTERGELTRHAVTAWDGSFRFPRLPANSYWMSCSMDSRGPTTPRPVQVRAGDTRTLRCIVGTGVLIDGSARQRTPGALSQ